MEPGEDPAAAAIREFIEELGAPPGQPGAPIELAPVRQRGGKWVHAWAQPADFDPSCLRSNTFRMEWPPRSGSLQEFPEVDRAAWFTLDEARLRILEAQLPLLDQLERHLQASASAGR